MSATRSFAVILFFLLAFFSFGQTIEQCDSIIYKGVEQMNKKNHAKSLELLTEARNMAVNQDWKKQQFLAINNIGANYYLMLDYGEALDNYLEAYKIALKSLDSKFEMIVLNNIGILYSKDKQLSKAEEYFLKAYEIAKSDKDSIKIGLYAINLATLANEKKEIKKAENYINIAYPLLKKNPNLFYQVEITKANNLVLKKELKEAKKILLPLLPKLSKSELSEHRLSSFMLLSDIYKDEKDIEKAIGFAKKAVSDENSSMENKVDGFQKLSDLNRLVGAYDKALSYKDSVIWANDSINELKNGQLFENSQVKFELQNYQNELSESHNKLESERKFFYGIIALILILIVAVFWAMRNNAIKEKQKKIIAEREQRIISLELEKEKNEREILGKKLNEKETISEKEQEKFRNEIETKNKQLTTKALQIASRNELLEEIITRLSKSIDSSQNQNLNKLIQELKNQLKRESNWDDFFLHFQDVNQSFYKSLLEKHPSLNQNDTRFLAYIRMNLATKEIASLFNITNEAVRKRKERILKKMGLPEDTEIFDYLSTI